MSMNIEPLSKWPEKDTEERKNAPFKATWSATLDLLRYELDKLSARNITLKTMHAPDDFRIDGKLRSDTRAPDHPGVVLTFEKFEGWSEERQQSEYTEMRLPCDTFGYWKDNVRAVALALEALRKIDRYGVKSGSQYAGFKALPAADFAVEMTPELAADFIAKAAGMGNVPAIATSIIQNTVFGESVYKTAAKLLHPDRKGGSGEEFKKLESAWRLVTDVQKQTAKVAGEPKP
jgi:hypothetical protein